MWAKMSTPVCIVGKRRDIEDALTLIECQHVLSKKTETTYGV